MKVLTVEDNEAIADLLRIDLTGEGYRCTCVHNGGRGSYPNAADQKNEGSPLYGG